MLIFSLPEEFGEFQTPLAYVWWFREFRTEVQATGMYKVSPSTWSGGHGNAAIIPITHIVRSCHLIPDFGIEIDRSWTRENVLKVAEVFYLNPYLRHLDFYLLRYLGSEAAEDEEG